jgi:hypothetical protein
VCAVSGVALVAAKAAAQPAPNTPESAPAPDAAVKQAVEPPRRMLGEGWERAMDGRALGKTLGHWYGMRVQLERIGKLPEFAERAKTAEETVVAKLGPGIEKIEEEIRRRFPKTGKADLAKMRRETRASAEKTKLVPSEIEGAFAADRWAAELIPTDVLAPILSFHPAMREKPERVLDEGYGATVSEPVREDGRTVIRMTVPRSWSMNDKRSGDGSRVAVFSDLGLGPAGASFTAAKMRSAFGDTRAKTLLEGLRKHPVAPGFVELRAEIVTLGGREVAVRWFDGVTETEKRTLAQRYCNASWGQDGVLITLMLSVSEGRDKPEPAAGGVLLDEAVERYWAVFDRMAASIKVETVEAEREAAKP